MARAPELGKVIACRWVFALMRFSKGEVVRHKEQLVGKEFSQARDVDCHEVFSPVARLETLTLLLTHVTVNTLVLQQADVKTFFLYSELAEEIYMKLPGIPREVST